MLMAVVLGAMGFAGAASAADDASATFTWSGTVPAAPVSGGFIIKDSAGNDIQRGALVFNVDPSGDGVLASSSTLDFNVYVWDGTTVGAPATSYDYRLTSLQVTQGGLPQEQDAQGYYAIMADGVTMTKDAPVTKLAGGATKLTVAPSGAATPSNQPTAGDAVDIHARIVISNGV
ncbi:hypothetical protein [Aeromonas sobria]|nr:hypothetical protein [Aeromonas sobria]